MTRSGTSSDAHGWRAVLSHSLALAAGVALALTFISHAAWDRSILPARSVGVPASDFDRALQAAMARMGSDMCIDPTGDVDVDFARAMIPHHQGAIEMARLELLYGRDVRLRRLAQGILVEQNQEITLLRGILDASLTVRGALVNP